MTAARSAAVVVVLLVAAALIPQPAAAHLYLVRSEPADGARLDAVPRQLRLTFSEPVQLPLTQVELVGPDGEILAISPLALQAADATVLLVDVEAPFRLGGAYAVVWRTTSADGHVVRGRIEFHIVDDAAGLAIAADPEPLPPPAHHDVTAFPEGDGFGVGSPGYVLVRWLTFLGLLGVVGIVAFRTVVLGLVRRRGVPEALAVLEPATWRSADLGLVFAALLAVAALARLYAQALAVFGPADALSTDAAATLLLSGTTWGYGWSLQFGATLVVLAGFAAARRDRRAAPTRGRQHRGARVGWAVASAGALVLAFTPALSGHAAAVPGSAALAVLTDGMHVLGASGWLGSLLAVVTIGVPAAMRLEKERRGRAVAGLVNAFSPTALGFAALVAVTGVISAAFHLGSFADLWRSDYGRALLLKVSVLSIVFATGAYNWLRVRPALGDDAGAQRLRRSAGVELAIGAVVLLITAVLVATPPPLDESRVATPAALVR
jgi:putative copper export protein/methionine-rich copper-binding protein CopC